MKIQIEILNYDEVCRHRTVMAGKKIVDAEPDAKHPTIAIVTGKGVITKSYDKDKTVIQRVTGNDTLYYTCDEEKREVSFVKKEQVAGEIDKFTNLLDIRVCGIADDNVIRQTAADFFRKILTIKNILRYKDDGKIILSHLVRKSEIPLLITVFAILLANFFVDSHFSKKNNSLQMELMEYKRAEKGANSRLTEIQKLKSDTDPRRNTEASVIIDLLASQVPDGITLNCISVDPLKRKVEPKKNLSIEKQTAVIKGETTTANHITELADNIDKLELSKDVKIKNIEQKRDDRVLEFEIVVIY